MHALARKPIRPMYPHLFLAGSMVNSREHHMQYRALAAGVVTLADWHAYRRAQGGK